MFKLPNFHWFSVFAFGLPHDLSTEGPGSWSTSSSFRWMRSSSLWRYFRSATSVTKRRVVARKLQKISDPRHPKDDGLWTGHVGWNVCNFVRKKTGGIWATRNPATMNSRCGVRPVSFESCAWCSAQMVASPKSAWKEKNVSSLSGFKTSISTWRSHFLLVRG